MAIARCLNLVYLFGGCLSFCGVCACVRVRVRVRACVCVRVRPRRTLCRQCARTGFAWGEFNRDRCPAGSYRITDKEQCKAAAATGGIAWMDGYQSNSPKGCISFRSYEGDKIFFNPDGRTGGADPDFRLLCADGTGPCVSKRTSYTHARTTTPHIRNHTHTHARAHTHPQHIKS